MFANIRYWASEYVLEIFVTTYTKYHKIFKGNARPLYIDEILFTLCQFQERRHNEVLSRNGISASATTCRWARGNSEVFVSCFLLALDVLFVVPVLWLFVHDKDNIYWTLQERDGGFMNTSEKWECYVFGQCEVGFNTDTSGLGLKALPWLHESWWKFAFSCQLKVPKMPFSPHIHTTWKSLLAKHCTIS